MLFEAFTRRSPSTVCGEPGVLPGPLPVAVVCLAETTSRRRPSDQRAWREEALATATETSEPPSRSTGLKVFGAAGSGGPDGVALGDGPSCGSALGAAGLTDAEGSEAEGPDTEGWLGVGTGLGEGTSALHAEHTSRAATATSAARAGVVRPAARRRAGAKARAFMARSPSWCDHTPMAVVPGPTSIGSEQEDLKPGTS